MSRRIPRHEGMRRIMQLYRLVHVAGVRGLTTREAHRRLVDKGFAVGLRTVQRDMIMLVELDLFTERAIDPDAERNGHEFVYFIDRTANIALFGGSHG